MLTIVAHAQKVYQIKADTVRIYNTCDTAELILENRTQNVSGYLFNKGKGRTEFRKIRLQQIGNSKIAITGQDTLDISAMKSASIDTIYRKGDSIAYVKNGIVYAVPAPLYAETLESVISRGNTTTKEIRFNSASGNPSNGLAWYYNTDYWKIFVESAQDTPPGNMIFESADNDNEGWIFRSNAIAGPGKLDVLSLGRDRMIYNGSNVWHAGNHPAGMAFTPALTGANVLAGLTTNNAGHITAMTTRTLTPGDIGAAASNIGLATTLANSNSTGNNNIIFNKTLSGANMLMDLQQGFALYSDNLDATLTAWPGPGKRLWVDAPDSGSMVLGPRVGAAFMNRIRIRSTNIRLEGPNGKFGNVNVLGTDANGDLINNTALFAPASGGTNYIQNQVTAAQTGNSWISGTNVMGRAAIYGTPDGPLRDIDIFNGTSAQGSNLRWSITKTDGEAANNQGTNLNFNRYDNAGNFLGTPLRLVRSSGVVDMASGFVAATSSRIRGSDTGNLNSSYIAFMEKDGATRTGFVGKTSTVNRDVNLLSDNGNVVLIPNYNSLKGTLNVQPSNLIYDGGSMLLNNITANTFQFNSAGVAPPSFNNRSAGYKVILYPAISSTLNDYAIGIEPSHTWFSTPVNNNSVGYKFYAGTTQVARLGGSGQLETTGQGRFKGWFDSNWSAVNMAGPAAEIGVTAVSGTTTAVVMGYDRTASAFMPMTIFGGTTGSNQRSLVIDGSGYKLSALTNATVLGTDANGYLVSTATATTGTANTIAQRDAGGGIYATGFFQGSKASFKKNIADFNEDALALLMKVRIKQFIYKDDPAEDLRIGIIADSTDWHFATKRHDKFDTNSSLAITMKALQELHEQNRLLKKENDTLKAKLEEVLQRIETIEAQFKK
ncbi:tail fiber domain-containing protein [Chitinophaga vietnamensis]|uniref:tail fiber domain-containing protein n=1 Tax=Chitinophaga vietnamensis TaxID=2593957 RepID=UPI001178A902|nr:tail fiber domain-containing protein [Chitinophaga vietnamensis]